MSVFFQEDGIPAELVPHIVIDALPRLEIYKGALAVKESEEIKPPPKSIDLRDKLLLQENRLYLALLLSFPFQIFQETVSGQVLLIIGIFRSVGGLPFEIVEYHLVGQRSDPGKAVSVLVHINSISPELVSPVEQGPFVEPDNFAYG